MRSMNLLARRARCSGRAFAFAGTTAATFARSTAGAVVLVAQVADHVAALAVVTVLIIGPPFAQAIGLFTSTFAKQQEVITSTETRIVQQQVGPFATAPG